MQRAVGHGSGQFSRRSAQIMQQDSVKVIQNKDYQRSKAQWPEGTDLPIEPDWRLSMPGNVGLLSNQSKDPSLQIPPENLLEIHHQIQIEKTLSTFDFDKVDPSERAHDALQDAVANSIKQLKYEKSPEETAKYLKFSSEDAVERMRSFFDPISGPGRRENLEISRASVPKLLQQPIEKIFGRKIRPASEFSPFVQAKEDCMTTADQILPERKLNKEMKVITFAFKTENNMTGWNSKVQMERTEKMEQFVNLAQDYAFLLLEEGYYCDFIDPSTGKAWFGQNNKNSTRSLLETDLAFETSGFKVEDIGCCKVLEHVKFGKNVFVGTIVSDAPLEMFLGWGTFM